MSKSNEQPHAGTTELDAWLAECARNEPPPQPPFNCCPVKLEAFREALRTEHPDLTEGDLVEIISGFVWLPESAGFLAVDGGANS